MGQTAVALIAVVAFSVAAGNFLGNTLWDRLDRPVRPVACSDMGERRISDIPARCAAYWRAPRSSASDPFAAMR